MAKKKVAKKNSRDQVADTLSGLKDLDKNISKIMKNMNASINISISSDIPIDKSKKVAKKK